MKLFVKFLIILLLTIVSIFAILYYNPHLVAKSIKSFTESSLSNQLVKFKIDEVKLTNHSLIFQNITLIENNAKIADLEKVEINYNLKNSIKKLRLISDVKITNFAMDQIKFDANGKVEYGKSLKKIENLNIDFIGGSSVIMDTYYKTSGGKPNDLSMNGKIVELPLMLHKALWSIAPDNGIISFLKEYIGGGYVSGDFKINLDKEFFGGKAIDANSLTGKFDIKNMSLKYDVEYPVLQNINTSIDMTGTKLRFNITHGYSGKVSLYDGVVDLDWEKGQNSEVIIKTKGHGPALDLIEFIPKDSIEELKKSGIDLTKMTGQIALDFGMTIPLSPQLPNIFDVKVDVSNMALKLFEGKVDLSNSTLKGTFDGKTIVLKGNGNINGFQSDLEYQFKLGEPHEVENILDVKLKFTPNEDIKKNFSIVKGNSIVNISYKSKGDQGKFDVNSNLTNVEFFAQKIGLRKPLGRAAVLNISSSGKGLKPEFLNIKVTGADNLQILGTVKSNDLESVINISKFQYMETDLKAQLVSKPHALKAIISGASLNLSNANMASFLEKDADSRDTDLHLNISKIKMKNNIWLTDFMLNLKCDKVKCYEGEMDSNIGTQSFRMRLGHDGSTERWEIISTNAGALLKAIGLYENMKAGSLMLLINTSRKTVKAGDIIPIAKGNFTLKKFVTTDAPILTRMVSYTSLAGLMGMLKGNKDIRFAEMTGEFSFKNEVLKIKGSNAQSAYFNFTMAGLIDTKSHTMKLKGNIMPEYYFLSPIARKIPAIGSLLVGNGRRRGLLNAPYSVNSKY